MGDRGLYEVPLSMSWLVWYYVGVKRSFQHAPKECESKGLMCFRCLMFSELPSCISDMHYMQAT